MILFALVFAALAMFVFFKLINRIDEINQNINRIYFTEGGADDDLDVHI